MKPSFKIGNRHIGYDYEPLVIAEIGINHEGSLEVAKQMVDAAYEAGAEIVKHQTHVVEDEMSDEAKKVIPGNADVSIYEIMERCSLNEEEEKALKDYIESKGMLFISTPFSREAAYRLQRMGVEAYKIGSGECNNYPLIKLVASFGKPIILSTGMNSIDSIRKSVEIMEDAGVPYALLHCTNVYPTPPELVRLGGMQQLEKEFPNAVIGLSDHCVDNYVCMGAVAVGASILERHFTDSFKRPGPDINCSMDSNGMADLIEASKQIAKARGGEKGAVAEEKVTIDFAFASVVAYKDIKIGEAFTEENLWVRRPGTGDFLVHEYESLIGKTAKVDIRRGEQLKREQVS